MGDFNVLLSTSGKNGPSSNTSVMLDFRSVISDSSLIDLPIRNKSFTWSNERRTPTLERLNRVFVSKSWFLFFPRSSLRALPQPRSDHTPLLLTAFSFVPSSPLFRFEAYWLRYQESFEVVFKAWETGTEGFSSDTKLSSKLSGVRSALTKWSAGIRSTLSVQGNLCLKWLEWLDKAEEVRILTEAERSLRPLLKVRYEELCLQEEIKWRQRSRVQWLREGDANTKFFHLKANCRRNKNLISHLVDGSTSRSSHDSIAALLFDFFRNQLGESSPPCAGINLGSLYPPFAPESNLLDLLAPFELDEVRSAVFSCAPDKAPGPDGFPMLFFQKIWPVLKDDLFEFFTLFFNGALNLVSLNKSWICLIPKKSGACTMRDFRPICLENSIIKILSKVLATRLQRFLDLLINPFQTAFIKGRSILDNFYCAHILSHPLVSTKQQGAIFKIDFERAFDHINWPFLSELLLVRGFGAKWISWISNLLHSSSTAVLLNGIPGHSFSCKRGLRQGDPLSPLLFLLCMDVLFRMLQRAFDDGLIPSVGGGDFCIHTLQFADDMLIFFDGSCHSARVIKLILDAFSDCSGLKINFGKSSIIPINLPTSNANALANFFDCSLQGFPIKYLGLPLSPRALCKNDFLPLIEKVDKRLAGWKGSLLSRGGRLVLTNSVLSSLYSFFCSAFVLPSWVIKAIDKIRRGFFWRGKWLLNGFHCLVKWERVCRPIRNGGLGIQNIRASNQALIMKGLWSFHTQRRLRG